MDGCAAETIWLWSKWDAKTVLGGTSIDSNTNVFDPLVLVYQRTPFICGARWMQGLCLVVPRSIQRNRVRIQSYNTLACQLCGVQGLVVPRKLWEAVLDPVIYWPIIHVWCKRGVGAMPGGGG